MAYEKIEKKKYDKLETEKNNIYTFEWSSWYSSHVVMIFLVGAFTLGLGLILCCCTIASDESPSFILIFGGASLIIGTCLIVPRKIICYTKIEPDMITIAHGLGKTELYGVKNIQYVTREEFDESDTTYKDMSGDEVEIAHGLCVNYTQNEHESIKYGHFTLIAVNYDELAMVTLFDGRKYLINYPKDLLKEMITADKGD